MKREPGIFPGYRVAAVAAVAYFATAPGQTFIVSLLNRDVVLQDLAIDKLTFNATYTIATVLAAVPLVFTGRLTDRFGPRIMLAIVAGAFALGCLVMSAAVNLWTAFFGFFCLRFLGQGSLSLVSSHAIAMWFHRKLGSINGVKIVGVFAAWAFLPQASLALMDEFGWRQTYVMFACTVALLVIPASLLFVRNAPEDLGLRTDNDPPERAEVDEPGSAEDGASSALTEVSFTLKQALRTPAYWILALTSVLPGFVGTAILFDMIPIAGEKGLAETHATSAVSAWTLTMAVMAIPAGIITDRVRPSVVIALSMLVGAIGTLGLVFAQSPVPLIASMVAIGLSQSCSSASGAATTARFFGRLHHGAIRSSLTRFTVFGTGLGPLATAMSFSVTEGYNAAMIGFVILSVLAAGLTAMLRPPALPG